MNAPGIVTPRLNVCALRLENAEDVFAYRSLPEVARYQSFRPDSTAEAADFIRNNTQAFNMEDAWFQLAICKDGRVIGDIGIHFIGPDNLQCELGYTLSPEYQKRGLAGEAVSAVVTYLFRELGKHRVIAVLNPENTASARLLDRLGFRLEGTFSKSYLNEGQWEDEVLYAVLESEWRQLMESAE